MIQKSHPSEAIVHTSFSSTDSKRADQIEKAILHAAQIAQTSTISDGHDLQHRHLTFKVNVAHLSHFLLLVESECKRLKPADHEIKSRIVV